MSDMIGYRVMFVFAVMLFFIFVFPKCVKALEKWIDEQESKK